MKAEQRLEVELGDGEGDGARDGVGAAAEVGRADALRALAPVFMREAASLPAAAELAVARIAPLVGARVAMLAVDVEGESSSVISSRPDVHGEQVRVVLKLEVEDRRVGALTLSFEPRRIEARERAYLKGVADVCAHALERARLADEERCARDRNTRLQRVTAALSRALTPEDVAKTAVELGVEALGARGGCLMLLDGSGQQLEAKGSRGLPRWRSDGPRHVSLTTASFVAEAVRTREPVLIESPAQWASHEEAPDHIGPDWGDASRAALPLIVSGRVQGTMVFGFAAWRAFSPTDRTFMMALAQQCADALERARLYAHARAAEEESLRTAARMRLVADLGETFAEATTDYPRLLDVVARTVAEQIEDMCVVRLLSDDGTELLPVASWDRVEERRQRVRAVLEAAPLRVTDHAYAREAIATGHPVRVDVRTPGFLEGLRPAYAELYARNEVKDLVVAPLRVRGRSIGLLYVARSGPAAPFAEADVALAQDIADRAALAIDNARLYLQATDAVRVRDEFLSVAGHELRTPLTALLLQVHSLARAAREEMASAKVIERAEQATRSGARLTRLIDELLDVSRVSDRRLAIEPQEVDLRVIASDVIRRASDELARAECTIVIEGDARVVGEWDRARLEQVVTNLLTNALKYGRGKPIEITFRGDTEVARVSVQDHGIGIAPADHLRIFDRFERAVSTRHFGGLGLGLWIVRQIVEAHGGTVRVDSRPGEGSVFTFELPRIPQCRLSRPPL